jgi:hypothetical protein
MQIPGTDATGSQRGAGATSINDKGKEKVAMIRPAPKVGSRSPSTDTGASTEPYASTEKKRRLVQSDRSSITEPALEGQQAPSKAAAEQVHGSDSGRPGVASVMAPSGPSDGRPEATPAVTLSGSGGGGPEAASMMAPGCSNGGGPDVVQEDAKKSATTTPDPKAVTKKTTKMM